MFNVPIHHSAGNGEDADARGHFAALTPLTPPPPGIYLSREEEHAELERLRKREREILELLGSSSSQRIIHDIRNLLNEVQLLRYLADRND